MRTKQQCPSLQRAALQASCFASFPQQARTGGILLIDRHVSSVRPLIRAAADGIKCHLFRVFCTSLVEI